MTKVFILTVIAVLGVWMKVAAQDAATASKRANQQYVLFESERDKGTNVTAMYSYLIDSYKEFMEVLEAPGNSQYPGAFREQCQKQGVPSSEKIEGGSG